MRSSLPALVLILSTLALATQAGGAPNTNRPTQANAADPCAAVPAPISAAIASEPAWSRLRLNTLQADDRKLWNAARPDVCPGFVAARLGVGTQVSDFDH